ncbi:MAG: SGNH/GDSL hydrolase family protein [Lachnospiraceae bacterium]|nr:SGNH/GDSL hydrolase family protein [Lachnospiraceae bacterium]
MKKKICLLAVVAALTAAACSSKTPSNGDPTDVPEMTVTVAPTDEPEATATPEPTATPKPTATPTPDVDWYEEMLKSSLTTTGNNARLKKVIEKARSGETVNIAAIGGSVTEGAGAQTMLGGYAYQFADAFAETYGTDKGSNINFVNAGLGGTPSSLGVIRYHRDVIEELGAEPDLLILEFSVNDYGEVTSGRAYESLIYDVLSQDNDAAVILVFAVFKSKWNMQGDYIPVGKYYDLPMVSIRDAISVPYLQGNLNDKKFFSDEYHPTTYGHTIMSDCIMHLIAEIDKEEADEMNALPETGRKPLDFCKVEMINDESEGVEITKGSFTLVDSAVQYFVGRPSFPDNWKHDGTAGNESFTMTLTCKNLLLNYKTANGADFGDAEVYVDGEKVMTLQGRTAGGWNNSNVVLVIDETTAAEHTVEVRMAEGQEDKAFTILALGYTK